MRFPSLALIGLAFVAALGVALSACGDDSGPEDLFFQKDLTATTVRSDLASATDAGTD